MQFHQIPSVQKNKRKPRVGRGGKRGTYSGRGQKGQKARAGHKIRPAVYDLLGRLPKLRGYNNKSINLKPITIDVKKLEKIDGQTLNRRILIKAGLVRKNDRRPIKILGSGEIKKNFVIEGLGVSKSVSNQIKKNV